MSAKCHEQTLFAAALIMNYAPRPTRKSRTWMMTTSRATKGVPIEAIQRVPVFADLNKHEVQEIARLFKEHRFSKGETIVQERSAGEYPLSDRIW
jgi:hypothetical protein